MLTIKEISTTIERKLFLDRYNKLAKMSVPESYIHECKVYGAYIEGELQGVFAFALGNDMAWPSVLPEAGSIFQTVPQKYCLEINLVWASGKLHDSYVAMLRFWFAVVQRAANFSNIDYITYAVDIRRSYLVKLYRRLACGTLFRGEVPKYPGREAIVFYTTPMRCKLAKLLCFQEFLIRFNRTIKRQKYSFSQMIKEVTVRANI